MQLVPAWIHGATGHTGGVAIMGVGERKMIEKMEECGPATFDNMSNAR